MLIDWLTKGRTALLLKVKAKVILQESIDQ